MDFEIETLVDYARDAIESFAAEHPDETFYAFAIDADMLCLNSVEQFEKTLKVYQAKYPKQYHTQKDIEELWWNTGDWEYQGFADFGNCEGFVHYHYSDHYELGMNLDADDPALNDTPYAKAMDVVIEQLINSNAFAGLKLSPKFKAIRAEHNY